jgi:N6-adenosine-specific RNA methylase IME4
MFSFFFDLRLNAHKANAAEREINMEANKAKKLYRTIMADPPWMKNQRGARGASQFYELMPLERIKNMPVGDLAEDNAACWLWVTNSTIDEGHEVLRAWGFEPKSILTWFKFRPQLGLGNYLRNDTEHVLLGIKGKFPIGVKNQPSWFIAPTDKQHSRKPDEFFNIAERCYPGPYLELFARRRYPGWDAWGNEIDSDISIPGYPVPSDDNRKGA